MIFGRPKFFNRDIKQIKLDRSKVKQLLKLKGIDSEAYLEAFDYFMDNPLDYDGASFVKDLVDLLGLDLAASRHDYDYIFLLPQYKGLKWLIAKLVIDFNYGKNMERLGKGIFTPYGRVVLLWLSTPFYLLYKLFKK